MYTNSCATKYCVNSINVIITIVILTYFLVAQLLVKHVVAQRHTIYTSKSTTKCHEYMQLCNQMAFIRASLQQMSCIHATVQPIKD